MSDLKNPKAMAQRSVSVSVSRDAGADATTSLRCRSARAVQLCFDAVEDAVDEAAGFLGAKFLGDLDRFVDRRSPARCPGEWSIS